MEIKIKKNGVYIPKWRGNDKLPEKEQIKFHHRFLTSDERGEYIYLKPITLDKIQNDKTDDREYIQDGKGIAKTVTTSIENLIIADGDKKKEIKDIKVFYTYSFHLLAAEYETYLLNANQVQDSKNSE